jgi:molybdate transport system ATP-binding protein
MIATSNPVAAQPAVLDVEVTLSLPDYRLNAGFSAPPGITVLFGASGSGKTTLLNCIAGLFRPDSGRIAIGNRMLFYKRPDGAPRLPGLGGCGYKEINLSPAHRRTGYVFQTLALFPHMTVAENVEYGLVSLSKDERRARRTAILDSFRIAHLTERKPGAISGGERQRVALARALVTDPCVLLLDEPLSALDAPNKSLILDDLRAWNQSHEIPVLYVTHSREEVFALAERVVVLEQGTVIAEGSPYDVLAAPRHESIARLTGVENVFDATVTALHEADGTMSARLRSSAAVHSPAVHSEVVLEVPLAASLRMPFDVDILQRGDRDDRADRKLESPLAHEVRVGIRAGDIILATARPDGLSARNVLPGTVLTLLRRDATVTVDIDCGVPMRVEITPAAERSLALAPGKAVWLIIKTHSCHLLQTS